MAGLWLKGNGYVVHLHVPDADTYFVVDGKRIYMSFHDYCGPSFYRDANHNEQIDYPELDENHKVWNNFGKWYKKYRKAKDLKQKQYEDTRNRSSGVHRDEPVQLALDLRPQRPRAGQLRRTLEP